MLETQTSKHKFPQDWSNITDKEAIERINHLLKHYKEYDIKKQGDSITIDGVLIAQVGKRFLGKCFAIGYPMGIYRQDSPVYQLIEWLYDLCKTEAEKREQQAKIKAEKRDKIAQIGVAVVITGIFMAGTWFIAGQIHNVEKMLDDNADRINKTEKRIEQKVKELEMIKTANTKDSVQKLH